VTQWLSRLTSDQWMPVRSEFQPHQKTPVVFLCKKCYPLYSALVSSRKESTRITSLTIKLK